MHRAISNLALLYSHEFNIKFPKLNTPPLQLSYIRSLYLPLEIYPAITSLQKLAQFKFAYLDQQDSKHGNSTRRFHRIQLPELQLMSLLIVALKLFYPLQGQDEELRVRSHDEPASLVFPWDKWLEVHKRDEEEREKDTTKLEYDQALKTRESDVFGLSEEQMDDYMDWYERMFVLNNSMAS